MARERGFNAEVLIDLKKGVLLDEIKAG